MKARLEGDERWKQYASQLGQAKFAMQQTELAFLTPPSQRSKARFMNVGGLVEWGRKTLALVDDPSGLERLGVTAERVQAKLGWLVEYREELAEWSAYQRGDRRGAGLRAAPGIVPGSRVRVGGGVAGRAGSRRRIA